MVHSYKFEYPCDAIILNGIHPFFKAFYQTSDTPDAHEKYADFFTEDATFVLASKTAKGREGMWFFFSPLHIFLAFYLWLKRVSTLFFLAFLFFLSLA
jgi:hypothetical protein